MLNFGIESNVPIPEEAPPPAVPYRATITRAMTPPPPPPVQVPYDGESYAIREWRRELRTVRSIIQHAEIVIMMHEPRQARAIEALELLGVEA
jgi:hypothetical protein